MHISYTLIFSTLLYSSHCLHEDFGLDIYELITKHGYTYEKHEVTTEDGYILILQRIPHGKNNEIEPNKPPILIMHGLLSSSADWVNIGPSKSLAYQLADQGFDVWLGNARGTTSSRTHVTLDPDHNSRTFFNFTFNEIGYYDLPAKIDYILAQTNAKQLQYVGFSQGTTTFFIMASERPEYNEKIKLMSALAPVGQMAYFKNPIIKFAANYEKTIDGVLNLFGFHELLRYHDIFKTIGKEFCDDGKVMQEWCKIFLFAIAGYDREQLGGDFIPVIVSNAPGGAASRQIMHFLQIIKNGGVLRKYDYGHNATVEEELPTAYDLSKITAPVALYYGENDWLASEIDTEEFANKLPNLIRSKLLTFKAMNHIDFTWATDIVPLLFDDVLQLIMEYK